MVSIRQQLDVPLEKRAAFFAAVVLSCVHVANVWLMFPSHVMRGLHLGFILVLIYLGKGLGKNIAQAGASLLKLAAGVAGCLYYVVKFETLSMRMNALNQADKLIGILLILVLIDATSRTVGRGMGIITLVFLAYTFLGQYLPGELGHAGYSLGRIVGHMYLGSNGIFGTLLQMSATYLAMFTLLGAFLDRCGASGSFINIAMKATGRMQGGPALAAVVASCFFGMINGSAVVNVVTTGTFTIPLMKTLGIAPHVAAAVEAAASTGGQLMPPVMGAGAFIMADITGVPYASIIVKALVPALVFFIGVFGGVYFYVKRENVPPIDPSLIPSTRSILKDAYLLLPMLVVLVMILRRYSPVFSAVAAMGAAVALVVLRDLKAPRSVGTSLVLSLAEGAQNLSGVATGLACAGLITGVVTLTGLGSKFVTLVIAISSGQPFLALVLVAFACLILGMGLPTSAAYVITATMAVPAMTEMGLPMFASHLFVFYFAVIAPVTPPVAIAAYAGAGIADASPNQAGVSSFVFALPAFLMPFMFVYNPLLLAEGPVLEVLWASFTAIAGAVALGAASQGYFFDRIGAPPRVLLGISAFLLIQPGAVTDVAGIAGIALIGLYAYLHRRRAAKPSLPSTKEAR